jgi:hypothetical protein
VQRVSAESAERTDAECMQSAGCCVHRSLTARAFGEPGTTSISDSLKLAARTYPGII